LWETLWSASRRHLVVGASGEFCLELAHCDDRVDALAVDERPGVQSIVLAARSSEPAMK
jgi:hypothetical protein